MENIYNVLAKHFMGETTAEEEVQIEEFRNNNPVEYKTLYKLWQNGKIELYNFDTVKAWKRFLKNTKKPAQIIQLRYPVRKIAAAIAILLITSFSVYYITRYFSKTEQIITENKTEEPLEIELTDGSIIWLKEGAVLSYTNKFRKDRKVTLSGIAFFDVANDQEHPFVISTTNSKVTVLGTSLNINSKPGKTEVTVRSGTVEVQSVNNNDKLIIGQNQTAIIDEYKISGFETTDPNYLAWQNGVFEFNNTSIGQVVKDLNTYYSNCLKIDSTKPYECSITAKFNNLNLEDILQIIKTTCNLSINKIDNTYLIQ